MQREKAGFVSTHSDFVVEPHCFPVVLWTQHEFFDFLEEVPHILKESGEGVNYVWELAFIGLLP